jgi:DNA polymerase-1
VESRAKIFKSVRDYVFSDEIAGKSDIAQILYDATDSYIEMERKGLLFDEKILPNLNNQDIRGNRIYFSYDLTGTVTGRTFSKIHPLPKDVKRHIYPDKNKVFVNFDYNAGEARILSHYSEDENLLDIFNNDQDLHKINAAVIFDRKNEEEVGTQERSVAKLVFFSIINGVSVSTLSKDLKRYKIDTDMTHKIKTAMQKVYSKSTSWISKLQSEAIQKKYVMNLFGRIRYLEYDIRIDESRAKKQASNAIIQSTLSDFKLVALGDIHKKYPGIMVAEFHDAILVELELNDGINAIIKDIIGIMSGIGDRYKLKCPLKASFEVRKYL